MWELVFFIASNTCVCFFCLFFMPRQYIECIFGYLTFDFKDTGQCQPGRSHLLGTRIIFGIISYEQMPKDLGD